MATTDGKVILTSHVRKTIQPQIALLWDCEWSFFVPKLTIVHNVISKEKKKERKTKEIYQFGVTNMLKASAALVGLRIIYKNILFKFHLNSSSSFNNMALLVT